MNGKRIMKMFKKNKQSFDKIEESKNIKSLFNEDFINKFLQNSFLSSNTIIHNFAGKHMVLPNDKLNTSCPDCVGCGCPMTYDKSDNFPDEEIKYEYNSDCYRCDEFNLEDSNYNFLFNGCSVTIGTGLPYEGTWAYQLNKDLGGKKFYNLATNGGSYKSIINDTYTYIRKYGKPKGVFIMFPNIQRLVSFIEYKDTVKQTTIHFAFMDNVKTVMTEEFTYYDFYNSVCALEDYLNSLNIPFLWSTWNQEVDENLCKIQKNFKNYTSMFYHEKTKMFFANKDYPIEISKKYWEKSRDMLHSGVKMQMWHKKILEYEWKKRYENIN
jgi:hypothetical protein